MPGPAILTGTIKYYDWGGMSFIPAILNFDNVEQRPHAEYWLGVHPLADCKLIFSNGETALLRDYINNDPVAALGNEVMTSFGNLPYLLKALDVRDMLSIQVHPSRAAAEVEFNAENERGIATDSPQRNYKDRNHKPELMFAMDEFWLLHGFKAPELMEQTLSSVPELNFLLPVFQQGSYAAVYREVMEMDQFRVNEILSPLLHRIIPQYEAKKLEKDNPDYWAAKANATFSAPGKTDRGIFSIYLFNLLRLQKGEAIFQAAGVPHAYIEGRNIEIMADSDNVLRGGLTTKHIDVKELLKHVRCEPTYPVILKGEAVGDALAYPTPAPDFELASFDIKKGATAEFTPQTAEILLLTDGEVNVTAGGETIVLKRGQPSGIVFPGATVKLTASADSLLFKATVPHVNK